MNLDLYNIVDQIAEEAGVQLTYAENANIAAIFIIPALDKYKTKTFRYFFKCENPNDAASKFAMMALLGAYSNDLIEADIKLEFHEVKNGRIIAYVY